MIVVVLLPAPRRNHGEDVGPWKSHAAESECDVYKYTSCRDVAKLVRPCMTYGSYISFVGKDKGTHASSPSGMTMEDFTGLDPWHRGRSFSIAMFVVVGPLVSWLSHVALLLHHSTTFSLEIPPPRSTSSATVLLIPPVSPINSFQSNP